MDKSWDFTLDIYDDGGGMLSLSVDVDEDVLSQSPRDLLRHLIASGAYILDHDLLDRADED